MLTRFRVNNFRSLLNLEFRPQGVNLFIGPNNAGKTNLCAALRFLGLSSEKPLNTAIDLTGGEAWNLTNIHLRDIHPVELEADCSIQFQGEMLSFSYKLCLQMETPRSGSLRVVEERLLVSGGSFSNTLLLENVAGQAKMLHEEGFVQKYANAPYYANTKVPADTSMLCQLFDLDSNPRAVAFRRYLRSWAYYNLSPQALRQPEVSRGNRILQEDGINLSFLLQTLHNENPRLERKLLELVQTIEPKLDFFSFSIPDPDHVYMFLEDKNGHRLGTHSLSDGTIRFLALTYILLSAQQSLTDHGFAPLILIEEPENGLYVGRLKPLLQQLDLQGKSGQFIFTTHSPYFIDLFDNNLQGIHLIKPGMSSSLLVKPDEEKVRSLLSTMPLGEMHFREMLG